MFCYFKGVMSLGSYVCHVCVKVATVNYNDHFIMQERTLLFSRTAVLIILLCTAERLPRLHTITQYPRLKISHYNQLPISHHYSSIHSLLYIFSSNPSRPAQSLVCCCYHRHHAAVVLLSEVTGRRLLAIRVDARGGSGHPLAAAILSPASA
jgi:hypothetical protein